MLLSVCYMQTDGTDEVYAVNWVKHLWRGKEISFSLFPPLPNICACNSEGCERFRDAVSWLISVSRVAQTHPLESEKLLCSVHVCVCICAAWNPNLNPSSLHPICGFNFFGYSSNPTEMKVLSKVSSRRGVWPYPSLQGSPILFKWSPEFQPYGLSSPPKMEQCNIANTSSYLVWLFQLANAYAEEEYVSTMLFQSMLHPLPERLLLCAPQGISLNHSSHPNIHGPLLVRKAKQWLFTQGSPFQQEGSIFILLHSWLQTGMLSNSARKHPQCANMHDLSYEGLHPSLVM